MINFYNVRTKTTVEVPEADCQKVVYGGDTNHPRYAFKATYDGAKLHVFCSKEAYYDATAVKEV